MKYTHIIWDFNGTLLDDVGACIKSVNTVLSRYGLRELKSSDEYMDVFGFPIIDYYRRLGFDFDKIDYNIVAREWVEQYLINCRFSLLNEGVKELLEKFKAFGIHQMIISMTESSMLSGQINDLGIQDYFDNIIGNDNIRAESKAGIVSSFISDHPEIVCLFIGDSVHDYEVASAAGADCILVSKGHQRYSELVKCPCPVFENFSDASAFIFK